MADPSTMPDVVEIDGLRFRPMIDADRLRAGIDRVAATLVDRYAGTDPLLVCILKGGAIFHADLIRAMEIPLRIDYLRASSYHGETTSSGEIIFTTLPGTQIEGENVIIVEDIVDTGLTTDRLREYFARLGASSVEVATLLYKRRAEEPGRVPEYIAFEIPDRFVVGFGLDYREQGRNLPGIYVLEDGE
jgi:hypoxanthine phosphoribosyltransferase